MRCANPRLYRQQLKRLRIRGRLGLSLEDRSPKRPADAALHPTNSCFRINYSSTSSVALAPTTSFLESTMRTAQKLLFLLSLSSVALGQTATAPATAPSSARHRQPIDGPVLADLDRLQAAASQANLDLGHMRIEKWKADSNSKQQAQGNADSVQRNLTTALPGLIANVRSAPQDVNCAVQAVSQSQCSL